MILMSQIAYAQSDENLFMKLTHLSLMQDNLKQRRKKINKEIVKISSRSENKELKNFIDKIDTLLEEIQVIEKQIKVNENQFVKIEADIKKQLDSATLNELKEEEQQLIQTIIDQAKIIREKEREATEISKKFVKISFRPEHKEFKSILDKSEQMLEKLYVVEQQIQKTQDMMDQEDIIKFALWKDLSPILNFLELSNEEKQFIVQAIHENGIGSLIRNFTKQGVISLILVLTYRAELFSIETYSRIVRLHRIMGNTIQKQHLEDQKFPDSWKITQEDEFVRDKARQEYERDVAIDKFQKVEKITVSTTQIFLNKCKRFFSKL